MIVKQMVVSLCERNEIKEFIETHHYSHNINGVISDYCFKLSYDGEIIGAMLFGKIAMAGVWKKYVDSPEKLIELRRLVCIDDTPKNTESYFIGHCLRWLRKNTDIIKVISYADNTYNHTGIIYKASNFNYLGKTLAGKVIMYNDKLYHDKTIRTKYKGMLKPYAQKIKDALLTGEAYYTTTKGKDIFMYTLR